MGGEELERFRLSEEFVRLVDETGIPFCSTAGAKAVVSEHHPAFSGVHDDAVGDPAVRAVFEHAGCRIGIGSWATSESLGGAGFLGDDWAIAAHEGVRVGTSYVPDVRLNEFVTALRIRLVAEFGRGHFCRDPFSRAYEAGLDVPPTAADHLDPGWEPDPPFEEALHDKIDDNCPPPAGV